MLFSAKLAIQAILFELFNRDKFLINAKCPRLSSSTYKRFICREHVCFSFSRQVVSAQSSWCRRWWKCHLKFRISWFDLTLLEIRCLRDSTLWNNADANISISFLSRAQNSNNWSYKTRIVRSLHVDYCSLQHNFGSLIWHLAEDACSRSLLNLIYATMPICYRVPETLPAMLEARIGWRATHITRTNRCIDIIQSSGWLYSYSRVNHSLRTRY